ncbi:metalloprotease family M67A [Thraustotheca clavata]|uniref:Metalloprotease family M67A n=1 Tax=Thraustotheca clavata TaxID=74557 RepID=A0A1W0ABP1_9STRA|nr:metalloprotease family M67A [Thraustotheca clavata]
MVEKVKATKETRPVPGRTSSKTSKVKSEKTRKVRKKRIERDSSSSEYESDFSDSLKLASATPSEPKCTEKDEKALESNQITAPQPKQEAKKEASTTQSDADEEAPQELNILKDTPLSMLWGDAKNDYACRREFVWDDNVFTDSEDVNLDRLASLYVDEPPSRGRRNVRTVQHSQLRQSFLSGATLDPHLMVECAQYADPTVSNDKRPQQPFSVRIHPDVAFVCDLHAHMAMCEIIGYFGGKYDAETNTVFIHAAFPCRSMQIEGDDGSTDVEMDPVSELEVRQLIEKSNLEVVGWYHSHPTFAPDPSIRDIENQAAHQELFQMNSHNHPFVGLIVGTYDSKRTDPVGLFRYFHVKGEKMTGKTKTPPMYFPFELTTITRKYKARAIQAVQAVKPTNELVPQHACLHRLRNEYGASILGCVEQVVRLLEYYRAFPRRTKWSQSWQKTNKGQKLRLSLLHYVEALDIPKDIQTAFVEDIFQYLQSAWQ